jgi:hypothetical protein
MRDTFFEQTEETRSLLKKLVGPKVDPVPEPIPEEPQIKRSLIELIEADAKGMITKQSAASNLMMLQKSTENLQVDEELKGVYVLSSEFSRAWEIDIANEETVAKWIKRRHDLFAEAVEEEIKTRVPHHLLDPIEAHMNPFGKIEKKKEITCFRVTSNLTYDFIKLQLEPQYSNLAKYEAAFLLLWSRRDAVLFWYVTPLKTINWSEHELPDQIRWKVRTFPAPELGSIGQSVLQIFWEMEELAKNDLKRFQPVKETV